MTKGRLEAFTDGVVAIIITIMVLEMKVPHGADMGALQAALPIFLTYVLSYINIGIFWSNHHHMLHATERVDGRVLQICSCCSGYHWSHSSSAGLTRLDSRHCRLPPMASCWQWRRSATPCFSQRSSREMAEAPLWRRLSAVM